MNPDILIKDKKADTEKSAFSFGPDFSREKEFLGKNCSIIAGIDEAGRGALAGPLSVGCTVYSAEFIMNPDHEILSIVNDSKKLSPKKRSLALEYIRRHALYTGVRMVSHRTVDRLNINGATEYAIRKIISGMPLVPDLILLDGNFSFKPGVPCVSIKRGDSLSISIASASIMAKVTRDLVMSRMDTIYSGYGLAVNKGYGTLAHRQSIAELGPSPVHRKSYEPVKSMLSGQHQLYRP